MKAPFGHPMFSQPDHLYGAAARGAILSPDGIHRYALWRRAKWARDLGLFTDRELSENREALPLIWVMLNPSTADAFRDDQTIDQCCAFASQLGAGGIVVVNLYAFRARHPGDLMAQGFATRVGAYNDLALELALQLPHAGVICGWGANVDRLDDGAARVAWVRMVADAYGAKLSALHTTKDGHPGHPLYLPHGLTPTPWPRAA